MPLTFHTLDVFTDTAFAGNPLAVVLDADQLDARQMQTIAREFNLSETVFVLKPANPAHSARVRIFTPAHEMPFAGHPTIGAAVLLADLRHPDGPTDQDALVVLEEAIGVVRVGVRLRKDSFYAEFGAPKLPQPLTLAPSGDLLAAALGLQPSEIGFENHKPTCYTAGNMFLFVPVASLEAIAKAEVQAAHWAPLAGGTGVFVYCRETVHASSSFHARMFAPDAGVVEDPATGSAAAAFAGVIERFDKLPAGTHKRVIEQGFEMGRPSLITLSLDVEAGQLTAVRIGGGAVRISQGTLRV